MNWDFMWGILIGSSLGFLFAGLIMAGRDDRENSKLGDCDENKKEVEE